MKTIIPTSLLLLLVLLFSQGIASAQSKASETCSSKEESLIDLNVISKCTIEKADNGSNKNELKISYRKIRKRTYRPVEQTKKGIAKNISLTDLNKNIDESFVKSELKNEAIKNLAIQEVLFSVADEIPLFPKCKSVKNTEKKTCFNKQMSKHFSKNFYPERATDEAIKGKAFIQFTIDYQGTTKDIQVKTQTKSKLLQKEIKRVISKLPTFIPGLHKDMPVNIKYSLPINLTLE